MPDDRLAMVQDFFRDYFDGKVEAAVALLEPSVKLHIAGASAPAGDFEGPRAVADHLNAFLALTEDPIDVLGWDDWLVGTSNVAGVARIELQRPGRVGDFRVIFLVEVSVHTLISRVEVFFSDQAAFERFFSN
jgi:ketosteroid isomerase-like protein